MKLHDVLTESYMKGLDIPMPILTTKPGVAAMLGELSRERVRELRLGSNMYLVYVGKRPERKEIANLIQTKFNVSFEKALSLVPGE